MGVPRAREPGLPFAAIFSASGELLFEAVGRLEPLLGAPLRVSDVFPFDHTRYYEGRMGAPLVKVFAVFAGREGEWDLARLKLDTNALEEELARVSELSVERPVNIDPGWFSRSKLILLSTKEASHRVPIGRGIHAEVTLRFEAGEYRAWPWTYPDYAGEVCRTFLGEARALLR